MRPLLLILLYFFITTVPLIAQEIRGVVKDSLTGSPIAFATVYIDGTTVGETTDDSGQFTLAAQQISLPATLIVSHLNYYNASTQVTTTSREFNFFLRPKAIYTAAVEVTDTDQRDKNLQEFRSLFLGVDDWGKNACIKDESPLLFERNYRRKRLSNAKSMFPDGNIPKTLKNARWAEDGKTLVFEKATNLTAISRSPLEIDLPDLGYVLYADLQRFKTDYKEGITNRLGTYFWQPYEGNEPDKVKKKHLRNRERAYYNSNQHFLRALFNGRLQEEGYAIYEVVDKDAVPFDLASYLVSTAAEKEIQGLNGRVLSILYYGDGRGRPLPKRKWKRASPVQSSLHIVGDAASIRADGTTGESPLLFGGVMGSRRAAWMLPSDYLPGVGRSLRD